MLNKELHVASFIVQVLPSALSSVVTEIQRIPSASIPISDVTKNKLIVVVENFNEREINQVIHQIENMAGVITVLMVYHQVEDESEDCKEST